MTTVAEAGPMRKAAVSAAGRGRVSLMSRAVAVSFDFAQDEGSSGEIWQTRLILSGAHSA